LVERAYHYRFEVVWPGGHVQSVGTEFTVSGDAPSYPGYVVFRITQFLTQADGGGCEWSPPPADLQPGQPVRFLIYWLPIEVGPMTYPEARAFYDSMTVTVKWVSTEPVPMVRQRIIRQHESEPKWLEMWERFQCSWTRRS
jgi:hypothetical protein